MVDKLYNDFIRTIELSNIKLTDLHCNNTNELTDIESIHIELNVNFQRVNVSPGKITASAEFQVNAHKTDYIDERYFTINALFLLSYSYDDEITLTEEMIERFIKVNVPLNAWPYGRELISSTTSRMGYPSLFISTLKS